MMETWSVGGSFAWGNPKHPPLNVRATAPDAISFDFVVTDHLWGLPGATAAIGAVMVPPREEKAEASPMSPPVIAVAPNSTSNGTRPPRK